MGNSNTVSLAISANGNKRPCDRLEDADRFAAVTEKFRRHDVTKDEITAITGCKTSCSRVEYTLRKSFDNIDAGMVRGGKGFGFTGHEEDMFGVTFAIAQTDTLEEREVLTYDGSSFVADVGGYLGLLLGMSMLDIYDRAAAAAARLIAGGDMKKVRNSWGGR